MSILTTTAKTTPLSADVVRTILGRHQLEQERYGALHDVFGESLMFSPSDGRLLGTSGMAEAQPVLDRFVLVSPHHRLTEAELVEVRIERDGRVIQSDSLRVADPAELPDVIPEPVPSIRPVTVVGERIASLIRIRHSQRVPQHVLNPGLGRSSSFVMPPEDLLYSPSDARLLGSAASIDGQKYASRAVRISTHRLPSVERIAAVAIDEYGVVEDIQP